MSESVLQSVRAVLRDRLANDHVPLRVRDAVYNDPLARELALAYHRLGHASTGAVEADHGLVAPQSDVTERDVDGARDEVVCLLDSRLFEVFRAADGMDVRGEQYDDGALLVTGEVVEA